MESLKIDIKESKEHINVITTQNKELTSELKEFEKQSEDVRKKLDRKENV
jgi:septal ring factor EnvC (AmiA/AmiB activator)